MLHLDTLDRYGDHLGKRLPSLELAFAAIADRPDPLIVELGASRSFVPGGRPGTMDPDPRHWQPDRPDRWDWGAGIFSRVCAEIIAGSDASLHVVDPSADAISIATTITDGVGADITFHPMTSGEFLRDVLPGLGRPVDLLYMDHHETCEEGARVHLDDTRFLLTGDLLAPGAVILVDDVHVTGPARERAVRLARRLTRRPELALGKGSYSVPLLVEAGFPVAFEGYQLVLADPVTVPGPLRPS